MYPLTCLIICTRDDYSGLLRQPQLRPRCADLVPTPALAPVCRPGPDPGPGPGVLMVHRAATEDGRHRTQPDPAWRDVHQNSAACRRACRPGRCPGALSRVLCAGERQRGVGAGPRTGSVTVLPAMWHPSSRPLPSHDTQTPQSRTVRHAGVRRRRRGVLKQLPCRVVRGGRDVKACWCRRLLRFTL